MKGTESGDEKKKNRARAAVVRELLVGIEEKLKKADLKISLADYIRLVQLQKELEQDEPREIRVTWVDRESGSSSES